MNGALTNAENIADNGGIKVAYAAYQKHIENSGPDPLLPGLSNYTANQLFWITGAQLWCTVTRPEYDKTQITTNEHTPFRWVKMRSTTSSTFMLAFHFVSGIALSAHLVIRINFRKILIVKWAVVWIQQINAKFGKTNIWWIHLLRGFFLIHNWRFRLIRLLNLKSGKSALFGRTSHKSVRHLAHSLIWLYLSDHGLYCQNCQQNWDQVIQSVDWNTLKIIGFSRSNSIFGPFEISQITQAQCCDIKWQMPSEDTVPKNIKLSSVRLNWA